MATLGLAPKVAWPALTVTAIVPTPAQFWLASVEYPRWKAVIAPTVGHIVSIQMYGNG